MPVVSIGLAAFVAVVTAASTLYLFLVAPARGESEQRDALFSHHYAHRGLHTRDHTVPENSISAFTAAVEAGYGIELDVSFTEDGEVVVFHDEDFVRACGIHGTLVTSRYAELAQFRLFGTEQAIPRLSDALNTVDGRVPLIVELKDTARRRELCEKTAALLDRYQGAYCIESFHPAIVRWFRRNRPTVVRGQLSAGPDTFKEKSLPVRLLLSWLLTNVATRPHFVAYRHEDGLGSLRLRAFRLLGGSLVGWTVTDTDNRQECVRFFDAVIFEYFRF